MAIVTVVMVSRTLIVMVLVAFIVVVVVVVIVVLVVMVVVIVVVGVVVVVVLSPEWLNNTVERGGEGKDGDEGSGLGMNEVNEVPGFMRWNEKDPKTTLITCITQPWFNVARHPTIPVLHCVD